MTENAKPHSAEAPSGGPVHRDRSSRARHKAREAKAERTQAIVSLLNRGVSVAEIASSSGVSIGHMRNLVRKILAERAPAPPAEFLALQVSRLNETLLVSYSAMYNSVTGTNFEAVDRVVKIVRELDRYHGLAAAPLPRQEPKLRGEEQVTRLLPPPAERPIAVGRQETPVLLGGLSGLPVAETVAERIENGAASD